MAIGDTPLTIVGNLVEDPVLRFTPAGLAVTNFRVASTPRVWDKGTGGWVDGDPLFLTCNIWRDAAENTAESLSKGMRIIVHGRLKQRRYETKEGDTRTVYEVEVDDVGPSLKFASAEVIRNPRRDPQAAGGGVPGYQPPQQQHQGNTWGQPAAPGGQAADDENPPF